MSIGRASDVVVVVVAFVAVVVIFVANVVVDKNNLTNVMIAC